MRAPPFFLAEYFDALEQIAYSNPILKLSHESNSSLYAILEELLRIKTEKGPVAEFSIKGLLYQFCGELILQFQPKSPSAEKPDTAPLPRR